MDWLVPNTFFEKAVFETKFELTVAIYRPCHFNVFRDEITFELAVFELPAFEITPSSHFLKPTLSNPFKMWRMDIIICHKCDERINIVGHRCLKQIKIDKFPFGVVSIRIKA